jgi:hypothetical protein
MNESVVSRIPCTKIAQVLLSVACLLFVVGLIKEPSPSDTIRAWLVGIFGVLGLLFYIVGRLVTKRR